jgi:hypothetical protein
MRRTQCALSLIVVLAVVAPGAGGRLAAHAKTQQAQAQQTPPPKPKPPVASPKPPVASPKPTPVAAAPAAPADQAAPPDLKYTAVYVADGVRTETVTYIKGERERFEFKDLVLLKQPDQKRTVQIMTPANTYLVVTDGATAAMPGAPTAPPRPPGVVKMVTTIVDTGERKALFGRQARRVKTMIDRQPAPDACDTSRQRIETDGWYIDPPKAVLGKAAPSGVPAPAGACADQIEAATSGDPKALGFPVGYTTTITGQDGKAIVSSMEITALEQTTLDPALFEIPAGMTAAMNFGEMAKTLSNFNEKRLADADAGPAADAPIAPKAPGAIRVGVPELTNKTAQSVNTRALRQRLIAQLAEAKIDAVPMAAAPQEELQRRAQQLGYDFVLLAEVTDLKVSKPGAMGGLMKAASMASAMTGAPGAAGAAGAAAPPKETTESTISIRLVQPDGKTKLAPTTVKGKDGGFTLQQGLALAQFAGGMYLSTMGGGMGMGMFSSLSSIGATSLGGMSTLGNPMLYQAQMGGLGGLGKGAGIDTTAGAAAYLLQQGMAMNNSGGLVGAPGEGPSYDNSLGEAMSNAAKAVAKAISTKK